MGVNRSGRRTYSHLADRRRVPSSYEIASSALLYYPERGFELRTPVAEWYRTHQDGSALAGGAWEDFSDPAATTYATYVNRQRDREVALDLVLVGVDDAEPTDAWLEVLASVFAPLRYPGHALMMGASYVGSMAPGGRVAIAAAFWAADEMRRVHRIARRLADLRAAHPGLGDDARQRWERDGTWVELRRLLERLLVTYDWGECFAALDLVVKPLVDHLVDVELAAAAREAGDRSLATVLTSLAEDAAWQRAWSVELVRTAIDDAGRAALAEWATAWTDPAIDAIGPLAVAIGGGDRSSASERTEAATAAQREHLVRCGLAEA
ncbi:MAG: toluene hydroxylase [Actinomycetota bacterium]|nr:toluene hydroxylase [Actinomycetota bacterium]